MLMFPFQRLERLEFKVYINLFKRMRKASVFMTGPGVTTIEVMGPGRMKPKMKWISLMQ